MTVPRYLRKDHGWPQVRELGEFLKTRIRRRRTAEE
jgi:hypothetical protein